ncbi:MAG: sigma-70 family RNA polymerase sigma factor [Clostridia bacterium]|nr:sigma-70 family RNA polymerase sigma factor [Clostridia bacterium]
MLYDSEILDLYVKRSEQAVTETAKKYERYCHSIAYGILSSYEEAEECVNDTYLNAWNAIPPHMPERLSAFLGKITRNLAIKVYEKKHAAKRGKGQIQLALSELAECSDLKSDVEDESNRRLVAEAISSFLKEQKEEKYKIFVQRYWYLLSIKQIAHENELKESQVKSLLFNMRADLKKFLEKEDLY